MLQQSITGISKEFLSEGKITCQGGVGGLNVFQQIWDCPPFFSIILEIVCNQTVTRPANSEMFGTSNKYGATFNFTCYHGYRRIGEKQITCSQDGLWDNDPPQCQGRVIFFLFYRVKCAVGVVSTFIRRTCT